MITVGDTVKLVGSKGIVGEVIGINKEGINVYYSITVKGHKDPFKVTLQEILGEVYQWRNVSKIPHHPTPEELLKCQPIRATAKEIADYRRKKPEFRVRLESGLDSKEEHMFLQELVFKAQAEYELKHFGMPDMNDSGFKPEPDPTSQIRVRDLVRVQEDHNLNSSECHTFSCNYNNKGHCHGMFRGDVNRCDKHTTPHIGEFSQEGDTYHLDIPEFVRNETDQLKEE